MNNILVGIMLLSPLLLFNSTSVQSEAVFFQAQTVNPILTVLDENGNQRFYTQQEIDNLSALDLNHESLNCLREKDFDQFFGVGDDRNYVISFMCVSINQEHDINGYFFSNTLYMPSVNVKEFKDCVASFSLEVCKTQAKNLLIGQKDFILIHTADEIASYQTQSQNRKIIDELENFDYFT